MKHIPTDGGGDQSAFHIKQRKDHFWENELMCARGITMFSTKVA